MSGRPVHLLAAAAVVAVASVASASTAFAGCFSGCGSYTYAAPVAYYSAPVVYSYSYAAPVAYAAPCSPCGSYGYSYGYAAPSAPMYIVNQGPAYTEPVGINAEPTPAPQVSYGYGNDYPWYGTSYRRYGAYGYRYGYRGYGYRRYGHRGYGYRYGFRGYRDFGYRNFGYRDLRFRGFGHQRYRYGAVMPGRRFGMHRPMGPMFNRGMHRMPGFVQPRHPTGYVPGRHPMMMMKKKP